MAQTHPSCSVDTLTEPLSLEEILVAFNNPINEEQAWAVCHQCAHFFVTKNASYKFKELYVHGRRSVRVKKDGDIYIEFTDISRGTGKGPPLRRRNSVTGKDIEVVTETDAIQALGLIIYHALDFGLGEHEERHLSRDLERLLEVMILTNPEEEDEGIEKDAKEGYTFQDIYTLCAQHLSNAEDAGHHYKAVCRALVAEAEELVTFLDKISSGPENSDKGLDSDQANLEELGRSDWTRLWVQIMKDLRRGVHLKKVDTSCINRTEYELTPFEILLEDIRSRRYHLNKVMVNGDIPPIVKKNAHAVILDFIRSRPPLHPVKKRVLKSPPERKLEPREKLLIEIRSQPKLKPVKDRKLLVETSRTRLNNEDIHESPQPVRKIIKPDFNLLLDSFDETDTDDCSSLTSSRRSSVASPSPERDFGSWKRAVVRDAVSTDRHGILTRRNTITVCESPVKVSPTSPSNGTIPEENGIPSHKPVHDARPNRLRRSGVVNKTHACANEVRQRLMQKLHGIEESLEPSVEKRVHRAACRSLSSSNIKLSENAKSSIDKKRMHFSKSKSIVSSQNSKVSSQEKTSSEEDSPDNDYVFDRSQGHRMPIPRKLFQRQKSDNSDDKDAVKDIAKTVKDTAKTVKDTVENTIKGADNQNSLQRSDSGKEKKEKPKPMVRSRSLHEIKPSVEVHQRSQSVANIKPEVGVKNGATQAPRPRPTPAPRSSIKGRASPVTVEQTSTKCEESPSSAIRAIPVVRSSRRTGLAQESLENTCDNSATHKKSSIMSHSQRKQILVSARKSSSSSNNPDSISSSLHTYGAQRVSGEQKPDQDDVQKRLQQLPDQPIEILSSESVQRRVRPQIVQRSSSHKFFRHSSDVSSLRAISDNSSATSPRTRSILLGRQRREAEELVKTESVETPKENINIESTSKESESRDQDSSSGKLSELNVTELLHVSEARTERVTNSVSPSPSINSDSDSAKWNHPIECLSLTLEEVMHIRSVLTKAELEQLITSHETYTLISKGKMCFTCKLVKFSMFGQWGTRCKICKRNVCNNCLRKMNIPTEHFQNIPVHTLSPIPIAQEALDILKVYESTGSVPHTPNSDRKELIQTANLEAKSPKVKSLQRSHTIGSGTQPAMLPNKNLLRGPQMNVCCDCKSMIMEVIRTSRTSIALINKSKDGQPSPSSPGEGRDKLNTSSLSLNIKSFFTK